MIDYRRQRQVVACESLSPAGELQWEIIWSALLRGFTLIELMLVIAIIAILAGICFGKFTGAIDRAKDATTIGNLAMLRTALGTYYAFTEGNYPVFAAPFDETAGYGPLLESALVPQYLGAIPQASESGGHHHASNQVFMVWNQTGNEDDTGDGLGQGWKYDANPFDVGVYSSVTGFGSIKVLCTHTNVKGQNWSTY